MIVDDLDRLALVEALMQAGEPPATLLEELTRRPAWHAQAACRGRDTDLWFPTGREPADEARAVCATCQVQVECAEAGRSERFGIWGGLSPSGRRRRRQAAA